MSDQIQRIDVEIQGQKRKVSRLERRVDDLEAQGSRVSASFGQYTNPGSILTGTINAAAQGFVQNGVAGALITVQWSLPAGDNPAALHLYTSANLGSSWSGPAILSGAERSFQLFVAGATPAVVNQYVFRLHYTNQAGSELPDSITTTAMAYPATAWIITPSVGAGVAAMNLRTQGRSVYIEMPEYTGEPAFTEYRIEVRLPSESSTWFKPSFAARTVDSNGDETNLDRWKDIGASPAYLVWGNRTFVHSDLPLGVAGADRTYEYRITVLWAGGSVQLTASAVVRGTQASDIVAKALKQGQIDVSNWLQAHPISNGLLAHWSFDDSKEYPDNPAGTIYFQHVFSAVPSGWVGNSGTPTSSFANGHWRVEADSAAEGFYRTPTFQGVAILRFRVVSGAWSINFTSGASASIAAGSDWQITSVSSLDAARTFRFFSNSGVIEIDWIYFGSGAYVNALKDHSPNGKTIAPVNGAYAGGIGPDTGQSLHFDGSAARASVTGVWTADNQVTEASMSCWCYLKSFAPATNQWRTLWDSWNIYATKKGFCWTLSQQPGAMHFRVYMLKNDGIDYGYTANMPDLRNQWIHVAWVYKASQYVRFYVNGELLVEYASGIPASLVMNATGHVGFGHINTGRWHGMIDAFRIYSRAITEAEVRYLYLNPGGPVPNMIGANRVIAKSIAAEHVAAKSMTVGEIAVDEIADMIPADGDLDKAKNYWTLNSTGGRPTGAFRAGMPTGAGSNDAFIELDPNDTDADGYPLVIAGKTKITGDVFVGAQTVPDYIAAQVAGEQYQFPTDSGLELHVSMDNSGAPGTDNSVNGRAATVGGAPTSIAAVASNGLSFDGTDDYLGYIGPSAPTALTMSVWFRKTSAPGATMRIATMLRADNSSRALFECATDGKVRAGWHNGSAVVYSAYSAASLCDNAWHHLAITHTGTTASFYVDGVLVGTTTSTVLSNTSYASENIRLGRDQASGYGAFSGDEFRVYSRALSINEVRGLFRIPARTSTAESATSYWLVASPSTVRKSSPTGTTYTPGTVQFNAYTKTGTGAQSALSGYWTITGKKGNAAAATLYNGGSLENNRSLSLPATDYDIFEAIVYSDAGKTNVLARLTVAAVVDGIFLREYYGTTSGTSPSGYLSSPTAGEVAKNTNGNTYWGYIGGTWVNIARPPGNGVIVDADGYIAASVLIANTIVSVINGGTTNISGNRIRTGEISNKDLGDHTGDSVRTLLDLVSGQLSMSHKVGNVERTLVELKGGGTAGENGLIVTTRTAGGALSVRLKAVDTGIQFQLYTGGNWKDAFVVGAGGVVFGDPNYANITWDGTTLKANRSKIDGSTVGPFDEWGHVSAYHDKKFTSSETINDIYAWLNMVGAISTESTDVSPVSGSMLINGVRTPIGAVACVWQGVSPRVLVGVFAYVYDTANTAFYTGERFAVTPSSELWITSVLPEARVSGGLYSNTEVSWIGNDLQPIKSIVTRTLKTARGHRLTKVVGNVAATEAGVYNILSPIVGSVVQTGGAGEIVPCWTHRPGTTWGQGIIRRTTSTQIKIEVNPGATGASSYTFNHANHSPVDSNLEIWV